MAKKKKATKKKAKYSFTLDELQAAVEDINSTLGMDPPIDDELEDVEELIAEVKENLLTDEGSQVMTTDPLEEPTFAILAELGIEAVEPPAEDEDDDDSDDDDSDDDDIEDDDDDDDDDDSEDDDDDSEDDDDIEDDDDDDDDDEPEEKPSKKKASKKPAKKATKKTEKSEKKKGKAPQKAGAPGRPGIIKTIRNFIVDNGPVTKEEILEQLTKDFPDRDPDAMKSTINVQVPNRINKEADFNIELTDDGYQVVGGGKKKKATKKSDKKPAKKATKKPTKKKATKKKK